MISIYHGLAQQPLKGRRLRRIVKGNVKAVHLGYLLRGLSHRIPPPGVKLIRHILIYRYPERAVLRGRILKLKPLHIAQRCYLRHVYGQRNHDFVGHGVVVPRNAPHLILVRPYRHLVGIGMPGGFGYGYIVTVYVVSLVIRFRPCKSGLFFARSKERYRRTGGVGDGKISRPPVAQKAIFVLYPHRSGVFSV